MAEQTSVEMSRLLAVVRGVAVSCAGLIVASAGLIVAVVSGLPGGDGGWRTFGWLAVALGSFVAVAAAGYVWPERGADGR